MAVQCKECGGAHPTWECTATDAKKASWRKQKEFSGGSSAVEREPSKPSVEGSTPSPRSKESTAALTEVQGPPDIARGSAAIGGTEAPTPMRAEIAGIKPSPSITTPKRVGRPRKHPDRKAYRAEWLRKDRRDHPEKYGKPAKKDQP